MRKIKLLTYLLIVVFFIGCNPSEDSAGPNDDEFAINFGNSVSKDFIGQVVDIDNHPIQNAEVKIGTSTVQTDSNGVFIIKGASAHERFAYITATKPGYIDGSRAMVPTNGKYNVKIMLLPNTPTATVQSGEQSEVTLPSGTKVSFDGEFQDENGNSYSGAVNVAMYHLMPSNPNLDKLMPGMLYAQTRTNQEAVLETFGMLNVELRGSSGQKLNIKEGHTAEITLKIDDTQTATAPNSIPLWHFDEEKGYWKEDGVATKVVNQYVGEVSHFSWWNWDVPYPLANLTVAIVDNGGKELQNMGISLSTGVGNPHVLYTDSNGQVTGLVPANTTITLTVFDSCGNSVYASTIGPFTADTVLPTIQIMSIQPRLVEGRLLNCDNTNVTNGYVLMDYGSAQNLAVVTNGEFSFTIAACSVDNGFTLRGFDYESHQSSEIENYAFTSPDMDVGNLTTCNINNEYINYQINSEPVQLYTEGITASVANNEPFMSINAPWVGGNPNVDGFSLTGAVNSPGLYTMNAETRFMLWRNGIILVNYHDINTINFNISQVGAVGSYVDITFSGTFQDGTSGPVNTISGTIHVRRDN